MRFREALVGACACAFAAAAPPVHAEEPPRPGGAASGPTPRAPAEPLPPISEARPPPLPEAPEPEPVPWEHHIEVGVGPAVAELPVHLDGDGKTTGVRFRPGPGFNVDLSWQVFRYLRFTMYVFEHDHTLVLPAGSLGITGSITAPSVHAYTFGARISPTLPIGSRVKLWLTAGAGWGFVNYGRFTVAPGPATIYERGEELFEIPLGLGGSVEIIPRWLSIRFEAIGSFVPSQIGDALQHGQFIGADRLMHDVGPMPTLDAIFVETVGLAIHL
jgi:hypothetical protein